MPTERDVRMAMTKSAALVDRLDEIAARYPAGQVPPDIDRMRRSAVSTVMNLAMALKALKDGQ